MHQNIQIKIKLLIVSILLLPKFSFKILCDFHEIIFQSTKSVVNFDRYSYIYIYIYIYC